MDEPILKAPIEEHLREAMDAGEADRMFRSFELRAQSAPKRRAARRRRAALWAGGVGVALAAAAVLVVVALPSPRSGPLELAEGHALPTTLGSHEDPSVYDLGDGSRIVLAPESEARVVANDATQMRTTLARGRATFDVTPGGPRRWIIDAGDARVEVVGTRFSVSRDAGAVTVRVERGIVEVHHPELDAPARLTAGDVIEVGREAVAEAMAPAPVAEEPVAEAVSPVAPSPAPERATQGSAWRARAERGDFNGAYLLLGSAGLARAARAAGAEDRLLLADVARRAGHPDEAAPILRSVMTTADPRAPVAAFTLGRIQLDQLREPREAARSFGFVARHPDAAALLEDAMALEAQAHQRAGDPARARAAAQAYVARFPTGRRAESMRQLAQDR